MKIKIWIFIVLLGFLACGDDGEGTPPAFGYIVYDGEAPPVNNMIRRSSFANVKAYSSAEAWLNGDAPIKSFTVNDEGEYESEEVFPLSAVFYVENGAYNNWPHFLNEQLNEDPNITDRYTGTTTVFNTLKDQFLSVNSKIFLISDVLVNSVSVFGSVSDCSKDNYIQLTKNAKLIYSEGSSVCEGKSASQTYGLYLTQSLDDAMLETISGAYCYMVYVPWADVENYVFIKTDFTKIYFRVNVGGDEHVTVYTAQNPAL